MFNEQLRVKLENLHSRGDEYAPMILALHYLDQGDWRKANSLLENADEKLCLSIWYDWAKGRVEIEKKNYLSAEVYIKKVLIRNALFYGAYEKMLCIFKENSRKDRAEKLLRFIDDSLPAFPGKDRLEKYRNWVKGEESPVANEEKGNIEAIDEIIRGVESGEISDEIPDKEKSEEFGSVLSEIFEPAEEKENNTPEVKQEKAQTESTGKRKIISRTLGEIYASQGQIEKALEIFEELAKRNPEDASLKRKLEHLRSLHNDSR